MKDQTTIEIKAQKDETAVGNGEQSTKADDQGNSVSKSIYVLLEEDIMVLDIPDSEKAAMLSKLIKVRNAEFRTH